MFLAAKRCCTLDCRFRCFVPKSPVAARSCLRAGAPRALGVASPVHNCERWADGTTKADNSTGDADLPSRYILGRCGSLFAAFPSRLGEGGCLFACSWSASEAM